MKRQAFVTTYLYSTRLYFTLECRQVLIFTSWSLRSNTTFCVRSNVYPFLWNWKKKNTQAIQQIQARSAHGQSTQTVPLAVFLIGAALDIFQTLILELDTEGRYLFLNAVANQLRYPNTHTHYFSFILLYLFAESNQVSIILLVFSLHRSVSLFYL